jgi:hypothetical protein
MKSKAKIKRPRARVKTAEPSAEMAAIGRVFNVLGDLVPAVKEMTRQLYLLRREQAQNLRAVRVGQKAVEDTGVVLAAAISELGQRVTHTLSIKTGNPDLDRYWAEMLKAQIQIKQPTEG